MKQLNKNWLTEGLIDFEYKKYMLLAYLKDVRLFFGKAELYPFLSDLVFHYKNLKDIQSSKVLMYNSFPKTISESDFRKLEVNYKKIIDDDEAMKEIEDILSYAIPKLKVALDEGKDIYEYVESHCEISPVGLSPLYKNEGYLFVEQPPRRQTKIFRYKLTLFESVNEKARGLNVTYITTNRKSYGKTYEQEKLGLIKQFKDLPNPATYLISSKRKFPFQRTYMPVAKRLLVRFITS